MNTGVLAGGDTTALDARLTGSDAGICVFDTAVAASVVLPISVLLIVVVGRTTDVAGTLDVRLRDVIGTIVSVPLLMSDTAVVGTTVDRDAGREAALVVRGVTMTSDSVEVGEGNEAVAFVDDIPARDEIMDDKIEVGKPVSVGRSESVGEPVSVGVAVPVLDEVTPVPTPVWLMPLDRASELVGVAVVFGFKMLLISPSIEESGFFGATDEVGNLVSLRDDARVADLPKEV